MHRTEIKCKPAGFYRQRTDTDGEPGRLEKEKERVLSLLGVWGFTVGCGLVYMLSSQASRNQLEQGQGARCPS